MRILVAGDAAVGKTSLVEMICSSGFRGRGSIDRDWSDFDVMPQQTQWTCGCSVSITRENLEVDMRSQELEVELREVGGTRMYSRARHVFYDGLDAILLVYDVSNMKSYHNLVVWLFELCTSVRPPSLRYWDTGGGSGGVPDVDVEAGFNRGLQEGILSGNCPVLFVAQKCDLRQKTLSPSSLARPLPPKGPPLLDRLLGGGESVTSSRPDVDGSLVEQLCDFVVQGRHVEASAQTQTFDFCAWRDFLRRAHETRRRANSAGT